MKRLAIQLLSVLFAFLFVGSVFAQEDPAGGQEQPEEKEEYADNPGVLGPQGTNLIQITLDDFEESEDWFADATSPLGDTKTLKMPQRGAIQSADDPEARPEGNKTSEAEDPTNPNHILGVKTNFDDRGFDRVEINPPHEYVIRGKARQFSVWVLGRKFRHTLSVKLRDYKGKVHKLRMGRLDFFGWRKMVVTVPGWMPQSTRYSLLDKNLHFVSLFVTSDHHEVPGTFYFYVDDLKVLVDRGELSYPGSEIRDNW